jgi:hypothetical protein
MYKIALGNSSRKMNKTKIIFFQTLISCIEENLIGKEEIWSFVIENIHFKLVAPCEFVFRMLLFSQLSREQGH